MKTLWMTGALALIATSQAAAQQGGGDMTAALKRAFDEVSVNVAKSADLVPADQYNYKPAATVRTFGQLIGHIADSYVYYCAAAGGKNPQWADPIEKGPTDKGTVVAKLKQAQAGCGGAYTASGQPRPLVDNIGHTNLHYGNIITYLRMLGLVPPSS